MDWPVLPSMSSSGTLAAHQSTTHRCVSELSVGRQRTRQFFHIANYHTTPSTQLSCNSSDHNAMNRVLPIGRRVATPPGVNHAGRENETEIAVSSIRVDRVHGRSPRTGRVTDASEHA